ncbi:MAG: mycofactocin precursor MftA [Actinomycetota bacterium]
MELESTIDTELRTTEAPAVEAETGDDALVEDELLVEEISIDGMCGVY